MDQRVSALARDAMTSRPRVSRRSVLLGAGAAAALPLLAACGDDAPTTVGPDQAALDTAAVGEATLLAEATSIQGGSAQALTRVAAAADAHRAHLAALVAAGASTSSTAPNDGPTVPPARTAAALARAQERQADDLQAAALGVSPRIAQLLGSIAASDAANAALLRGSA